MNVLHIIGGSLNSGAGKGTLWLHRALIKLNIDSYILTNSSDIVNDCNIFYIKETQKDLNSLEKEILSNYSKKSNYLFSTGFLGIDFLNHISYKKADIIHLHWINDCHINIRDIEHIDKPIVWTLRDMWPFTGGCHYSMGCERFQKECISCPQLNSNIESDLSNLVFNVKKEFLANKNISFVGISNWISEKAKESSLFKTSKIQTIYNGIDISLYNNINKDFAKKSLNLPIGKKILLIGAKDLYDYYKGIDKFIEACNYLEKKRNYHLISFGENSDLSNLGLGFSSYTNYEFISDESMLNKIYSAADVFIAPSIFEAFGKTIVESMLSGTPVVCFDSTGPKDIIDHKVDGYKAEAFNTKEIAKGIEWIINNPNYQTLADNATKNSTSKFSSNIIAKQYINLYKNIISKQSKNTSLKQQLSMKINKLISLENNKANLFAISFRQFFNQLKYKIKPNNTYIIYGGGTIGKTIHALYSNQIVCYLDLSSNKIGYPQNNKEIFNPENITNLSYDFIIISVLGKEQQIIEYLTNNYKIETNRFITIDL